MEKIFNLMDKSIKDLYEVFDKLTDKPVITCIEKPSRLHMFDDLTVGNDYLLIAIEGDYYKVKDDMGIDWAYNKRYFKIKPISHASNHLTDDKTQNQAI